MSHFAILVVTDDEPTDARLSEILQPWHEYECTGVRDQYVVEVDKTDEVLEQFNDPQKVVLMPDGQVLSRYDDSLYVDVPDEIGGRSIGTKKKFKLPDQAEEREMTAEEARKHGIGYASLEECAKDYFGIDGEQIRDGKFYDLTNPNKKWDWWVVGGRWSGVLAPRYEPSKDPANQERCWLCEGTGIRCDSITGNEPKSCNGCRGTGIAIKFSSKWRKVHADRCRVRDLDLEDLRDAAEESALREWDKYHAVIAGRPVPSWDQIRRDTTPEGAQYPKDIDACRKKFNEDPVVLAIKEATKPDHVWDMSELCERLRLTREERSRQARLSAPVLFGYVKDGQWHERGEMGWFAMVSGEKDKTSWGEGYNAMLASLRPDQWVTVVDCHI